MTKVEACFATSSALAISASKRIGRIDQVGQNLIGCLISMNGREPRFRIDPASFPKRYAPCSIFRGLFSTQGAVCHPVSFGYHRRRFSAFVDCAASFSSAVCAASTMRSARSSSTCVDSKVACACESSLSIFFNWFDCFTRSGVRYKPMPRQCPPRSTEEKWNSERSMSMREFFVSLHLSS